MLRDIRLRDFRCFAQLVFEPSASLNFIVGANAQGKTSLLEAACVLLRLQSPRSSSLAEAVRFGRPGFGLDGHWNRKPPAREIHRRVEVVSTWIPKRKRAPQIIWPSRGSHGFPTTTCSSCEDRELIVAGISIFWARKLSQTTSVRFAPMNALCVRATRCSRRTGLGERLKPSTFLWSRREKPSPPCARELCEDLQPRVAEALRLISGGSEGLRISYLPGKPARFFRRPSNQPRRRDPPAHDGHRSASRRYRNPAGWPPRCVVRFRRAATFRCPRDETRSGPTGSKCPLPVLPFFSSMTFLANSIPARRNNLLQALPAAAQKLVTATSFDWLQPIENAAWFVIKDGTIATKS